MRGGMFQKNEAMEMALRLAEAVRRFRGWLSKILGRGTAEITNGEGKPTRGRELPGCHDL